MATLKISDKSITRYFGFLKNMDVQSTKKLIAHLTETKKGIDHLFGAWEDTRTAGSTGNIIYSQSQNRAAPTELFIVYLFCYKQAIPMGFSFGTHSTRA